MPCSLLGYSLWGKPAAMLCGHSSNPIERELLVVVNWDLLPTASTSLLATCGAITPAPEFGLHMTALQTTF